MGIPADSEDQKIRPFDVQRNNTAMVSEATYLNGCIVSVRRQ